MSSIALIPRSLIGRDLTPKTPSCPSSMSCLHHCDVFPFSWLHLFSTELLESLLSFWSNPRGFFFFLNSPSPWHFYFICHFSLEMFSSPLVLLTEVSILLPHLLDPIIPSSSTLPFPTPFLHSLSTFYKEPPLGIRWFFVNLCFGILSPSFFVYPVINFHWSPPIVLDSPGIQT